MDYSIIDIRTVGTAGKGQLSFFESAHDIPFEIKHVYYIYEASAGIESGRQVHRSRSQMLWCPYGSIEVVLDDGSIRNSVLLNDPTKGLVISGFVSYEMVWKKEGSVLAAATSDEYGETDNIREYSQSAQEVAAPASQEAVANCWIVELPRQTVTKGVVVPTLAELPLKRVYYTYDVPAETERGGHAHKDLVQVLVCPHGCVEVLLDDGKVKASVYLDRPNKALVVGKMVWHDMIWHGEDSVLLVTASDYYAEADYIRQYDAFIKAVSN